MEDPNLYTQIVSAIGTLGFPIVACVYLFRLYDKTVSGLDKTLQAINTLLNEMNKKLDSMFMKEG